MAAFTSAANTGPTEMDLILAMVQDELARNAIVRPTVLDLSSQVESGIKSIEIPRYDTHFTDPSTQPQDGDSTEQTVNFDNDVLNLDVWKTLPWSIPDQVALQSRIPLESELARSAGQKMAVFIDDQIIAKLKLASSAAPDHVIQMTGAGNAVLTLADISNARMLLKKANVPQDGLVMLISPEQEKAVIDMDTFHNADSYGSREALLNGEVGRIYGFKVIVSNGLSGAEAIFYHRTAVAFAAQKNVSYETRRADLTKQKTQYSFSLGMGFVLLEEGRKQVFYNATGAP